MNAPSFTADEQMKGCKQAEAFLARLHEPVGADDLAQQIGIARFGSIERQRAFVARIQQELVQRARGDA